VESSALAERVKAAPKKQWVTPAEDTECDYGI